MSKHNMTGSRGRGDRVTLEKERVKGVPPSGALEPFSPYLSLSYRCTQ
jgi:hypothetical protein